MSNATRKTHTGLICCCFRLLGGWLLGFCIHGYIYSIIQMTVAFLHGATQQM